MHTVRSKDFGGCFADSGGASCDQDAFSGDGRGLYGKLFPLQGSRRGGFWDTFGIGTIVDDGDASFGCWFWIASI